MLALVIVAGCGGGLSRVHPPSFDVDNAAAAAMKEFDSDGNGRLSQSEASACRGILDDWDVYDLDASGEVTKSELTQRFETWTSGNTGLMNLRCEVTHGGRPLIGADIRLVPYAFLGETFYSAHGATDKYGFAFLRLVGEDVPESLQGTYGVQVGLYRVEITHPEVELPAKYNRQTELSVDLSPADGNTGISFALER